MNKGDGSGMFGDSTSQGGKSRLSYLPLNDYEVRGASIADRDRYMGNIFPSPDQDSHFTQAKWNNTEHSNGASPMETSCSISPSVGGLVRGSDVCGDNMGCGPQAAVLCQPVSSKGLLCTNISETL